MVRAFKNSSDVHADADIGLSDRSVEDMVLLISGICGLFDIFLQTVQGFQIGLAGRIA
jgi:hypothetical protein